MLMTLRVLMRKYPTPPDKGGLLASQFSAAGNVALWCLAEDDEDSILRVAQGFGHYLCQGFCELPLLAHGDL